MIHQKINIPRYQINGLIKFKTIKKDYTVFVILDNNYEF